MRYLISFSYDGSKFHGFQRQKDVVNVQGTLEEVLSKLLEETIVIKGSGRTDAGVHALMQTAHFDTNKKIDSDFKDILNDELGNIIIQKIKRVDDDFHARFSVKEKTYRYIINLDKEKMDDNYYFTSFVPLNIEAMKQAGKLFIGPYDFHNFVSGDREDYYTEIYKISIKLDKNKIIFEFTGAGFYRYMIRHLVGALYDIGRGKVTNADVKMMLDNPNTPRQLTVMPANGLYLVKVRY